MEVKQLPLDRLELKFAGEDMTFSGYASVFGGVDSYGDTIDPKAYDETLKERQRPVRMRWNHYGPIIGKWNAMYVDEKGLYVAGQLTPGHSTAIDVYASLKHGSIDGMSIGYRTKLAEERENGQRLLKSIELIEISVVEEPADLNARIEGVKSELDLCNSIREMETFLREVGRFSKSDSIAILSRIKRLHLGEQEAEQKLKADIANIFGIQI